MRRLVDTVAAKILAETFAPPCFEYRSAFIDLVELKRIEAKCEQLRAQSEDDFGDGVKFAIVPSEGHHMQNDEPWAIGAKVLSFYEQL